MIDLEKKKHLLVLKAISNKIKTELFPKRNWIKILCINKIIRKYSYYKKN